MSAQNPLVFKFATEDLEFEQIHRLNYKTFVEEIPQHQRTPAERLVDRFHEENTYLICLSSQKLVGMLAVRAKRPFSLDQKLHDLDTHLPAGRKICEIRLLAIEKNFRGAQVLQGILALLWQHCVEKGYDLAIISGTTRQPRLYRHLGFVPFGPIAGSGDARFQPMYVTLEAFEVSAHEFLRPAPAHSVHSNAVNFLPGPVTVRREVRWAFEQAPESHRGERFMKAFQAAKQTLCHLVHAKDVELFMGSGTLANDVVAAQLSLKNGRGVVITNGEFGNRLVDHARRFKLDFAALEFPWGEPVDLARVRKEFSTQPAPAWLWCAHCETATGLVCDLDALKELCVEWRVQLCLDCISSIGTMPVNLSGVHLATCSSGKGLRAYSGVSMVFHNGEVQAGSNRLPRYLDLGYYAQHQGIPFTFCSNLLYALHAAVKGVDWPKRFAENVQISAMLRSRLARLGFNLIGNAEQVSPAVVTISLPPKINSANIGEAMHKAGYLLSYNSEYVRRRNWIQVCLMGDCTRDQAMSLVNALYRICFRHRSRAFAPANQHAHSA